MSKILPSKDTTISTGDLENWNTDRSGDYAVMLRGQLNKSSAAEFWIDDGYSRSYDAGLCRVSAVGGSTVSLSADAVGNRVSAFSDNAATFRVSALGVTATMSPLSADSSAISAKQQDAANLRVSAYSDDASKFRVYVVSGSTGVSANQQLSCMNLEGTAHIGQVSAAIIDDATINKFFGRISAISEGANLCRVSVITGSMISATLKDGTANIGSVSVIGACSATMKEGTAFIGQISCAGGLVSATNKEGTSFIGQVSAILKDNPVNATYLGRVSVVNASAIGEGTAFIGQVSAILKDNATTATYLGRVSTIQGDAVNQNVSCKSNDAGTMRTSAYLPVDTVGQITAFRSLSLSASQAVKAAAGAVHGYYLWNTTTVPQYVKMTNTSGAINVGTDVPVFMAMLPASAAANVWFGQGIKGFTAGIGVHASSAVADNATTPAAASAVGGVIFYN
jgi:hypothetical protein